MSNAPICWQEGSQRHASSGDHRNTASGAISLAGVGLAHRQFDAQGRSEPNSTIYWEAPASWVLQAGQILRVHTGREIDRASMNYTDSVGAHFHAFAEKSNFVLNNNYGDEPSLWAKDRDGRWSVRIDGAWYLPYPPEGVELRRVGDHLVP